MTLDEATIAGSKLNGAQRAMLGTRVDATVEAICKALDIHDKTLWRAAHVRGRGTAALVAAVERGETTVSQAYNLAQFSPEVQDLAVVEIRAHKAKSQQILRPVAGNGERRRPTARKKGERRARRPKRLDWKTRTLRRDVLEEIDRRIRNIERLVNKPPMELSILTIQVAIKRLRTEFTFILGCDVRALTLADGEDHEPS